MAKNVWLVKSEPNKYPFRQLVADKRTLWDGVRNYEARNNLRAMALGDWVIFYHSNEGKEMVGLARVEQTATQDPTTTEDWSVVELAAVCPLVKPVTLAAVKAHETLCSMALVKKSRISVVGVTPAEFKLILALAATKLPTKIAG